jgi:hypothetical protein
VRRLAAEGRSIKLDLKEGGPTLEAVIRLVTDIGLPDERVWFNGELATLGADGLRSLRERFPRSTISTPVDFVIPLVRTSAEATAQVLDQLRGWGVTRLSLRVSPVVRRLLDTVEALGWELNLYGIDDLDAFLEAAVLHPTSITADFNFPEWHYYGRGSGEGGRIHMFRSTEPVDASA